MAFPLIPVLVGAAAAAAVVYFVANKNAQKRLTDAARDLGDSVQSGAEKLESVVTDAVDDAGDAAKDAAAKLKDAASKAVD